MENQYLSGLSVLGENYYPSLQQLRRLFDASPEVICSVDLDGRFRHVSRAAAYIWGYPPEELIGRNYMDFVVEEDQSATRLMEEHILRGHKTSDFENCYRRKNGTVVHLSWSAQWDPREKVIFCIARDIAEQKTKERQRQQYEQAIRQQHQEMQNMLERIDEGFYALDESYTVTYWNHYAEVILSRKRKDVLGKCLWDCYPELLGTELYHHYLQALNKQVTVKFTTFLEPLSAWYEVRVYPSTQGLSVFFQDVTGQKQTEEKLHMLSLIVQETNNLVIVTDACGRTTWVNKAFTRKAGYTLEEMKGRFPGELLRGPGTDSQTARYIQEQSEKGAPFCVEILNYTKTNETYWVEITAQPVYSTDGVLTHYFAIQTDITERKKLQQRLAEDMRQRQQQITTAVIKAQEQERSVIGRELHDNVNQVLTTVKLYVESCQDGLGNREQLLCRSLQLLSGVINDIRGLSKQLAAPHLEEMQLQDSVQELVENLSLAHRLSITARLDRLDDIEVEGGLHLTVYRILQEHLTNVIKHAAASSVQVMLKKTSEALTLIVVDDGVGFDPGQKKNGIGILNMKSRAGSMGGTLKFTSRPGQGCTLLASFPLSPGTRGNNPREKH